MDISACIFDLDGVIVDTAKFHFDAWNRMAQQFGGTLTHEQNEELKGVSRMASLDFILAKNNVQKTHEEKLALASQKNEWYLEMIKNIDKDELLPGIELFLEELKSKGIKIGLGSASRNATTILQTIGIDHYFEVFIDGNAVVNSKPHPEVFLKGAEGLSVKPENCLVFEDSEKGVRAANIGGFIPIGIGEASNLPEAKVVYSGFENIDLEIILSDLKMIT